MSVLTKEIHLPGKKKTVVEGLNLVPLEYRLDHRIKSVTRLVSVGVAIGIIGMAAYTGYQYIETQKVQTQIDADNTIIASANLTELNKLQMQYDGLVSMATGKDGQVPNKKYTFTQMLDIVNKHMPSNTIMIGMDGEMRDSGEYAYRLDYLTTKRGTIPDFLQQLQQAQLYFVSLSSITKIDSAKGLPPEQLSQLGGGEKTVVWKYSITIRLGGAEE